MVEPPLTVPALDAGGLLLRSWRAGDRDLVCEASTDPYIPLVTRVPVPCTEAQAEAFVDRQVDLANLGVGYPFVIAEAGTGRPLGAIGVWLRDIGEGRASVGYWVAPSARGRGVAARALGVVADWGRDVVGIPRLELHVEPWNTASVRTAERAGFDREGLLRSWQRIGGRRRDLYLYSRIAEHAE